MDIQEPEVMKSFKKGAIKIFKKILGRGTFGVVHLGRIFPNGPYLACKIINKKEIQTKIEEGYPTSPQSQVSAFQMFIKNLRQQIKILKEIEHQNIVRLIDFIETDNNNYIILEYIPSGYFDDLGQPICDFGKVIKQDIKKSILTLGKKTKYLLDIARGLHHLYTKKIYHRDLKPQNVLIQDDVAKITDFGQSKWMPMEIEGNQAQQHTLGVGSPYYRSIQILQMKEYSIKCDIWSFGVMSYYLFFKFLPWEGCNSISAIINKAYLPLELPTNLNVPAQILQLIKNTINIDENQRWNAEMVLEKCQNIYFKYKDA